MSSLTGQNFDGSTGFTDTHDNIQGKAGNVCVCACARARTDNYVLHLVYCVYRLPPCYISHP